MKKTLLILFLSGVLNSYAQDTIQNAEEPKSLMETINNQIFLKTIAEGAIIYFNDEKTNSDDLALLNEFDIKEFLTIDFLSKKEAVKKFGKEGQNGAVLLKPFIDDKLTMQYYSGITNKTVIDKIAYTTQNGSTKSNPILVVDGIPLRAEEIASTINALDETMIKQIIVLKKIVAYRIYGIRAINGVLLITTTNK
jgi:hypothetical protein